MKGTSYAMKKFSAIALAAIVLMSIIWHVAPAAAATNEPDCKNPVQVDNIHKQDSGHHGLWADLVFTRMTKICVFSLGDGTTTYKAEVHDQGALVTISGAALSPRLGADLAGGREGTMIGDYVQMFTVSGGPWNGWADGDHKPAASTTPTDWVKTVYGVYITTQGIESYTWTYKTCTEAGKEKWVDSSSNNDGTDSDAGDITGVECDVVVVPTTPPASPTASPSPVVTETHSATPIANVPTLPVTGAKLTMLIISGILLVVSGILLVVMIRMRPRKDQRYSGYTDD